MNVMDKDHRFERTVNKKNENGEEIRNMSEWLTRVIDENQAKGRAEGRAEGEIDGAVKALTALVQKHKISIKEAAEQVGMSEAAFCEKAGLPLPQ